MRSLQRHQRWISTTDFHSISDESECSWMIQILDMLWYSSMNPNWYQKGQKQVVGTSLENDFVNSFKTMMCCFPKEMFNGYHFFSNFHTCRKSGTGWPANAIAHKCKGDLAALFQGKQHSWSLAKKRFCNVLSKKQCKFHIAQSCRSQTAWESQICEKNNANALLLEKGVFSKCKIRGCWQWIFKRITKKSWHPRHHIFIERHRNILGSKLSSEDSSEMFTSKAAMTWVIGRSACARCTTPPAILTATPSWHARARLACLWGRWMMMNCFCRVSRLQFLNNLLK